MSRYTIRRARCGAYRGTWKARRPNLAVIGRFHTWALAMHAVGLDIRERSHP
jgi:hypothetical protein